MSNSFGSSRPVRYYFDEHVRLAVVSYLRGHSIDVLTTLEAGRANQEISDADQLEYATTHGYVLVSSDKHFLNPRVVPQLATGQHAGVVRLREGPTMSVGEQARYLRFIAETETMGAMSSQIRYYERIPRGLFADD